MEQAFHRSKKKILHKFENRGGDVLKVYFPLLRELNSHVHDNSNSSGIPQNGWHMV